MKNIYISEKFQKALKVKQHKHMDIKGQDWDELDLEAWAVTILGLERDVAYLVNEEAETVASGQRYRIISW